MHTETLEAAVSRWLQLGGAEVLREAQSFPLLEQIRRAIPESAPLYRGMSVPAGNPVLSLNTGDIFTLGLSSFSRSAGVAAWYLGNIWHPEEPSCAFALSGEWRGFDLAAYMAKRDHRRHECAEVITAGRFAVLATERLSNGDKIIHIQQTAVYGIPHGWDS